MIARVFPRRTRATPNDVLAFVGEPPKVLPALDEVHISVTFTWDIREARRIAPLWKRAARCPVKLGGPALGERGGDSTPGMFLRDGYVITSRGCPNVHQKPDGSYVPSKCWFCSVPQREGPVRQLPITEGYNVLDDNLLACSQNHILAVVDMLRRQKLGRPQFTGGIEAALLKPWSASALRSCNPKQVFFALDTADDWEPLVRAADLCWKAGFTPASHTLRCFVLCGFPTDDVESAALRMVAVSRLGIVPMAMRWQRPKDVEWQIFQKRWARPATAVRAAAQDEEEEL